MIIKELSDNQTLTESERILAGYICKNYQNVLNMTAKQLAQNVYVSTPTVIRLCKKLGFENFAAFKVTLSKETTEEYMKMSNVSFDIPFQKEDDLKTITGKMASLSISSIVRCRDTFDYEELDKICGLLSRKKFIDIYGIGLSLNSAQEFCVKMNRIGYNVSLIAEASSQIARAVNATPEQAAIILSYSGYTKSNIAVAEILKKNRCPIIVITGNRRSSLLKYASRSLLLKSEEPLQMTQKTDSFGTLYMFHYILDCLFAVIFSKNYEANLQKTSQISRWQFI